MSDDADCWRMMEALGLQGLTMIPEGDYREPLLETIDDYDRSLNKSVQLDDAAKPIVKKARRLLYRRLKVGVEDGRLFVGKFHCLDKQGNIILYDTVEFWNVSTGAGGFTPVEQRVLGMILIPARCRISCHVECSLAEQLDLLSLSSS